MRLFFFYGSLMSGYWNNQRVIKPKCSMIDSHAIVPGFQLWLSSHGIVPCACPSDNPNDKLHGEIWQIDAVTAMMIDALERGYKSMEMTCMTLNPKATIYYCDKPEDCPYIREQGVLVPSGNYRDAVDSVTRKRIL